MITYKLKINCQEPRVLVSDMEFVAGDVNAYRLEFAFYDNGERVDLSDKILTVKGKRADGIILSGTGQIDGAQAVFVPANAFYAVPGELVLEIALTDSAGNYMTTKILSATVLEGLGETTEVATTNVSAYVSLLAQLTNRLNSADRLLAESKFSYESELAELQAGIDAAKAGELYYGDKNMIPTDARFFTYEDNGDGTCAITGIVDGYPSDIVIPYEIDGLIVVGIGGWAFFEKSISSVIMPDTITSIGESAFVYCNSLSYVRFSNKLESIGYQAFESNPFNRPIVIPDSVTSIDLSSFMWCFDSTYMLCNKGSYAETFAIEAGFPYKYIDAKDYIDDIETALDAILAIQEGLIGGESA